MPQKSKKFWIDHKGQRWKVPTIKDRLRPHQIKSHAALRAFVICRAGGMCARCGSTDQLLADHIVSKRNGGTHHPDNLQCLCKPCNDRKSNFEDRGRTDLKDRNAVAAIKCRRCGDCGVVLVAGGVVSLCHDCQ